MKYIIAIALMFAIATPVFAIDMSDTDTPSSVDSTPKSISTTDTSTGNNSAVDTDSSSAPEAHKKGNSSGSKAFTIQDKIFNLTGVRFEKTNDQRFIEIYNTLYQILLALKTV